MESLKCHDWGTIPYGDAYEKQKVLFNEAIRQKSESQKPENILIYCEHPHVITIGKHGLIANLLFPEAILKEKKVDLYHVDRGGDITYHGPGQLVGYPIFDLEGFSIGLKEYIFRMEEAIIHLLNLYHISGERLDGATGVWIDTNNPEKARKICAVGVRSSRFVTMHGFALNVNTDLDYFQLINPCGFKTKGVTSMEKELGEKIEINHLKSKLFNLFIELFS